MSTPQPTFTVNIQKGGALLDDCRRVVELWDPSISPTANLDRISRANLLAKPSRTRTNDVLARIIRPRFVEPGPHILPALKAFLDDSRAFREACYYETAREERLLAAFAQDELFRLWTRGRVGVQIGDATSWLESLEREGRTVAWTDLVRTKVARGLLAALRDFGVLRGERRKELLPPSMTPRGFAYVAWRLHEQGSSSRALAASPVWRQWLLEPPGVQDLFAQAARLGVLSVAAAGSAVRIDWKAHSLAEVTGAAA